MLNMMGCSTSISSSCVQRQSLNPSMLTAPPTEKKFGKVSMVNGDGTIITTGTVVPIGERTQYFGRIIMKPILKIKSDDDGNTYEQKEWIARYDNQVKSVSVYASDPEAAKAYAENVQKFNSTRNIPRTPRTPRPNQMLTSSSSSSSRRTFFFSNTQYHSPFDSSLSSTTTENIIPSQSKLDLPPFPPMITPPRLV